jgi:Na+(H+)/acetate symporter ActP
VHYGEPPNTAVVKPTWLALLLSFSIAVAYFGFILIVALAKPPLGTVLVLGVSLALILAAGPFGVVTTLVLIYGSPSIQVDVLKSPQDVWFPLRNPGLVSIPASFLVAIIVSWCRRACETVPTREGPRAAHLVERDGSPA